MMCDRVAAATCLRPACSRTPSSPSGCETSYGLQHCQCLPMCASCPLFLQRRLPFGLSSNVGSDPEEFIVGISTCESARVCTCKNSLSKLTTSSARALLVQS